MTFEVVVKYAVFFFVLAMVTSILAMGLRLVRKTTDDGGHVRLLSEQGADGAPGKNSFSRTAAAIGAFGLTAFFVGTGYWVLFTLFFGKSADLKDLDELGVYFLSGSALFAPYAFNQLKGIFRP